jgi:hypothetical protein
MSTFLAGMAAAIVAFSVSLLLVCVGLFVVVSVVRRLVRD